ncbi:hypothetical protein [Streptomyces albidoflavus]
MTRACIAILLFFRCWGVVPSKYRSPLRSSGDTAHYAAEDKVCIVD